MAERAAWVARATTLMSLPFLFADSVAGDVIQVPSEVSSIQAAIDASQDGDEVVVSPGVYHEAINFIGKAIVVRSCGGSSVSTIEATGLSTSVVTFVSGESSLTVLEGFTITGGTGTSFGTTVRGGGLYMYQTSPTIRNCAIVENSTIVGSGNGAGMWIFEGEPLISGCSFLGNDGGNFGGGVFVSTGSPKFIACNFLENDGERGGGIYFTASSDPTIERCRFIGNSAYRGGALAVASSNPIITNCLFVSNDGDAGGAIHMSGLAGAVTLLTNCTFSGNSSPSGANIFHANATTATIANCILWNSIGGPGIAGLGPIGNIQYSDVEGYSGDGTFSMDPHFVDPANGDFHLRADSPCIDTGSNALVLNDMLYDLDGHPRILDGNGDRLADVDMGTYELAPCPADIAPGTGDGTVSIADLLFVISNWGAGTGNPADINGDDVVNIADLLAVISAWGACR
jgi:parallel beta-helix repeat protein